MITFQPDTDNRTTRARVAIPEAVRDALERTYRDQVVGELPYEDQEDADALVKLFKTHANRRGLRLIVEYAKNAEDQPVLKFKMRDKRPYTKRSAHWHQASA